MTYFPKFEVSFSDTENIDSFGRLRTAQPFTLFDSKQLISQQPARWTEKFWTNATASYSRNRASETLIVTSSIGSRAVRQTRQTMNYQPGKSLQVIETFVFGQPTFGIKKRVGYFDDNNGVFLEQNGSEINFVLRSNVTGTPVDTVVSQSSWNGNKLDGTDSTGDILDLSKAQILALDFQWLGVGRVRCSFNIDGLWHDAHSFYAANVKNSVYMSSPNLPVRSEIINLSGSFTGSLEQICTTVVSDGGYDSPGYIFSADRAVTPVTTVTDANLAPVISIRLKSGSTTTSITPIQVSAYCTSTANYYWCLLWNPTFSTDAASWIPVLSSSVEYDVSRTASNVPTGGIVLGSGYGSNATNIITQDLLSRTFLGIDLDGNRDQLVLAVRVVGNTTESFLGSITWKEVL